MSFSPALANDYIANPSSCPMQQLGHSNNAELFKRSTDPSGLEVICSDAKAGAWTVG
jgi:hypothetical protein